MQKISKIIFWSSTLNSFEPVEMLVLFFFSLPFTHLHDRIWIKWLSNKKKHLPFICIHLMVAVQFKKRSQFSNNIMQTYVTSTKLHEQECHWLSADQSSEGRDHCFYCFWQHWAQDRTHCNRSQSKSTEYPIKCTQNTLTSAATNMNTLNEHL